MNLPGRVSLSCFARCAKRLLCGLAALVLVLGVAPAVQAELAIPYANPGTINPVTYTFTAASTGDIIAYFAIPNVTASDTEEIGLLVNGVSTGVFGLDNHASYLGEAFDLGHANAGDTLTFVLADYSTGMTFYSTAALNPDGVQHVYSTTYDGTNPGPDTPLLNASASPIPYGTYVAFEDRPNGSSDFNYHDDAFVFSNTAMTATPEPSSAMIAAVVGGLGGVGLVLKRRRAATRPTAV